MVSAVSAPVEESTFTTRTSWPTFGETGRGKAQTSSAFNRTVPPLPLTLSTAPSEGA